MHLAPLLRTLRKRPALLWLTASGRVSHWESEPGDYDDGERDGDGTYHQLPALKHHGVAVVSVLDALKPYRDEHSARW